MGIINNPNYLYGASSLEYYNTRQVGEFLKDPNCNLYELEVKDILEKHSSGEVIFDVNSVLSKKLVY